MSTRLLEFSDTTHLPARLLARIERRLGTVEEGVARVERAAGLRYPLWFVEPALPVAASAHEFGQLGVLFARTVPVVRTYGVEIHVYLSVPLVLYAVKGTLHAVLAHEFLHYADWVRRFRLLDLTADPAASTLFEARFADAERLLPPARVFRDKRLVGLLAKRFQNGFNDAALEAKTVAQWLHKHLPVRPLAPDAHMVRLPLMAILRSAFDDALVGRLRELVPAEPPLLSATLPA
jgi:hypothetical protein